MAFDNDTRKKLADLVSKCRALLTDEFLRQCQSTFGIQPDGLMIALEDLERLSDDQLDVASQLRDRIDYLSHNEEADNSVPNSIDKMLREQAFTVLNRLAAMKMAEARGLIVESVSKGQESEGFVMYDMIGGSAMGDKFARYVCYLRSMFDEIAVDLGSLFDRFSPFGLLFPNEDALGGLLELLNQNELEHLWAEDETIGWIYQYWNSKEERKAMRDASAAPRNSRELAVRNQFFTPRYVVEFLTDNTLGRTWYEMAKGETRLADQCRYLVRRPTEIFLNDGEEAHQQPEQEGLSQEELLKQPVYIQHRSFKDPREIRLLDPACGSMHFGLYAFDLFEAIYEEGWEKSIGTLKQDFPDKTEFLAQVPRLIIENNIHGVDIDPRAVQIAGLSLWLRAQRSWKNQSIQPGNRLQIRKSNIVCAEPMPGDEAMLEEFLETLDPPLLRDLVSAVFEKMKLAGEAGTLLKIEEEIRSAIQDARNAAHEMRDDLFTQDEAESEDFFDSAEERIYESLQNYAESAERGDYQRRLFTEDAAHGFAFIDLCRKRYDAVVMNPPFGKTTVQTNNFLEATYPEGKFDLASAFIERMLVLSCSGGRLGQLTARAPFYTKYHQYWRQTALDHLTISVFADLGGGVLDSAWIEVCATVLSRDLNTQTYFSNPPETLLEDISILNSGLSQTGIFIQPASFPKNIPQNQYNYWLTPEFLSVYDKFDPINMLFEGPKPGASTGPTDRYIRLWAEIPQHSENRNWANLAKGGEYGFLYPDVHLSINWKDSAKELKTFHAADRLARYGDGNWRARLNSYDHYFKHGVFYSRRSTIGLSLRVLPSDCVFSEKAPNIIHSDTDLLLCLSSVSATPVFQQYVNAHCALGSYEIGSIGRIPFPEIERLDKDRIAADSRAIFHLVQKLRSYDELSINFLSFIDLCRTKSIQNATKHQYDEYEILIERWRNHCIVTNKFACRIYGIDEELGETPKLNAEIEDTYTASKDLSALVSASLLAYVVGVSLGRWDIRYATGERQPPELPDPFDPLPVCPPGMLQNADGLPASESEVPEDYPLRISWSGILVDDEGHPEDIITRVREALSVIWKDNSSSIEQEACEILKVKSLRDYFAEKKSGGKFFKYHLKRYSKSRRKAPIYWPLSTESGSYTLWIYYHRLTDQTLYQCVSDFIEPKIEQCEKDLQILNQQFELGQADGKTNDQISELKTLINELKNFRDELLDVARLPYKPNLNDGVQITAAPLWKCFRLGAWQKTLKDTWKKLEKGDYDWAHLSYSIWPERVRDKCIKDKSLAIAHGLEEVYIEPPAKAKKAKKASTEALGLE